MLGDVFVQEISVVPRALLATRVHALIVLFQRFQTLGGVFELARLRVILATHRLGRRLQGVVDQRLGGGIGLSRRHHRVPDFVAAGRRADFDEHHGLAGRGIFSLDENAVEVGHVARVLVEPGEQRGHVGGRLSHEVVRSCRLLNEVALLLDETQTGLRQLVFRPPVNGVRLGVDAGRTRRTDRSLNFGIKTARRRTALGERIRAPRHHSHPQTGRGTDARTRNQRRSGFRIRLGTEDERQRTEGTRTRTNQGSAKRLVSGAKIGQPLGKVGERGGQPIGLQRTTGPGQHRARRAASQRIRQQPGAQRARDTREQGLLDVAAIGKRGTGRKHARAGARAARGRHAAEGVAKLDGFAAQLYASPFEKRVVTVGFFG